MKIETTLSGSFPKLPLEPGAPNVRVIRNRMDQGKATQEELADATRETTKRILALQEGAGVDIPVDGQVAWDDAQTYLARGVPGFTIAGLIRYLDTNTYYRQPEITGPVSWKHPVTAEDFKAAQSMAHRPLKAVLPGPYSLYRFSRDLHYKDVNEGLRAVGEAVSREAKALEDAGALGLDLVEAPESWDLIPEVPAGKTVALGLVDARNTKLEDPARVAEGVRKARSMRSDLSWQLCPTASLEYLPVDRAAMKVARLTEAARLAS
ncbi:MAG: hypothetical protein E6K71_00785 [Candidatus Eisenbacteria bacterium]|uniref:Cobalamin-independent methionine synthase MetE C-terminal/archaeal domain-containing protein n=1 Tax=Eiseniibacteriota bacterium TaxID=2212470 RepID=A0A538SIF6_UNCEI|nr:MAG: hypothetical protein E6K71_00785 [Candidatus Eisenbacteria bacterium]